MISSVSIACYTGLRTDSGSSGSSSTSGNLASSDDGPCVSELRIECVDDYLGLVDVACGEPPEILVACQRGCSDRECIHSDSPDPCTPEWKTVCDADQVIQVDLACDSKPVQQQLCENCLGGACQDPVAPQVVCVGNSVYQLYPGGEKQFLLSCEHGCEDSECVADPCPHQYHHTSCHDGDLYYFDDCDQRTGLAKSCPGGCVGAACVDQAPVKQSKVFSFKPSSSAKLYPLHVGGDKEFKGHGPYVSFDAKLIAEGNKLSLSILAKYKETKSDWTEGRYEGKLILWTAPAGCEITKILTPALSTCAYTDVDHAVDVCATISGPVQHFVSIGDTSGDDIGATPDKTHFSIEFKAVSIEASCTI